MKTIAKDNTKLIRKENTKGNFSTIKNSIKYDLRLSPTSRLILLEVFSNSDDFAYSESYILKFLGMTKQTYYKYRDELIKFGYLKIKSNVKNPNLNYYIFSEFGNLKTEEETVQSKVNPEEPKTNPEEPKANPEVEKISSKTKQLIDRYKTKIKFAPNGNITIPDFHSITNDYFRVVPFNYVSSEVLKIEDEKSLLECVNNLLNLIKDLNIEVKKIEEKDNSTEKILTDNEIMDMVKYRKQNHTKDTVEIVFKQVKQRYKNNEINKDEIGKTILTLFTNYSKQSQYQD